MIEYVVGFLFDPLKERVVLIRKNRPDWQAGKWNGVGGHVESTDSYPKAAMIREFREETGLEIRNWTSFCTIRGDNWRVHYYWAVSNQYRAVRTVTDEMVLVFPTGTLPRKKIVVNVRWLIAMALSMSTERADAFEIKEIAA